MVRITIVLSATLLAGCFIEAGDDQHQHVADLDGDGVPDNVDLCPNDPEGLGGDGDGCPPGNYATIGATWAIKTANGATASCPPGFDTAALFNVATDAGGTPIAPCNGPADIGTTCFVDLFNCEDHVGVSAPLPPARYRSWVAITDQYGLSTYATSLSALLNVTSIDLDINVSIFTDGGFFALDWELEGANTNAALTCAQAGATGVETIVTVSGGSTMIDTGSGWPCEDHYGVTPVIPVGTYTVSVDAYTTAGSLGTAPDYTSKTIQGPNKVTDLGTAIIAIDGL